ncbi:LysR family transcriptional regulator [Pseudophaeobacter sp.]|jgi:DNA-binding transcriptional LysR family regulator|uniref:LysR family transcriptional regulator n=1 Tax=unclassified Pseudophaeobacter TaxID=2637024 RepID=UPI0021FE7F38|nr:LysR family transcriptional regulator [Phaeobacter sp. G2]
MIELRDLQLVTALARHKHFAKAAKDCGMSQPAFSMRIRNLEEKLGLSIVRRGNRFQGLTGEGEMIVRRARGILDDAKALEQEVSASRGEVTGTLMLGVVPTATAFAAQVVNRLHEVHPRVLVHIDVTTSMAIQQRILDGTIDAGVTYSDSVPPGLVATTHLYEESYVLLAPEPMVAHLGESISWQAAAALPLSLLEPGMQNRRILDRIFAGLEVKPDVMSESSGFMSAIIMAREGAVATILPRALADALGEIAGTRVLDLMSAGDMESQARPLCLACLQRTPELTTVASLRRVVAAFMQ